MRLNLTALGLLFPVAAVLSGCGMGNAGSLAATGSHSSGPAAAAIKGKAYGGQQPVAGSIIALYSFGSTGYGSTGQLLAETTTDPSGYFNIDPNSIQCPSPATPVYLLSIGGDPGFGPNSAILLGSGIGACQNAANAFVTINEVSTAALAYTFSHFFSNAPGLDTLTTDHFGAPASATSTVINANSGTLFTFLDVENGYPRVNTANYRFEGAKLITVGNILGACVNSIGPSSPSCSSLFRYISAPDGSKPTNTLEAAVDLALSPQQNVPFIFALQPPSGAAAFSGGLTSAPFDWSLSASYTSPNFALGVNTRTTSTIDIDTAGRVWFPSNGPGKAGVGFYDPSNGTFSQLLTGGLTHPEQVAIDVDNYVWATDTASPNIAGFTAGSTTAQVALTLPGTTSTAVTVAYDNSIGYGIVAPDGQPGFAKVTGKSTYTQVGEVPGGGGFIASSLAGDVIGGFGVAGQELRTPTTYDLYFAPNGSLTPITYQTYEDAGQVVFTGNNFVGTRGGYSNGNDGICIWSAQGCFPMANSTNLFRHPSGMSVDGAGSLWLADQNGVTVEQIPLINGSYLNANNQANNLLYLHNSDNGGTLPTPTGIAVDGAGNVWVSNFGCYGDGCTPGNFTLSEIIGLAAPTITPVSRQVVINDLAGTEPQKKAGAGAAK